MNRRRDDQAAMPLRFVAPAAGLTYYVLAAAMLRVDPTWGSAFWPAAGVTFGVLVRSPKRHWAAIALAVGLAELVADLQFGIDLATSLWGAAANVAEPLAGAACFCALTRQRTLTDLVALRHFLVAGVFIGPPIGALLGGWIPAAQRGFDDWLRWFVGDAVGVVAVAPLLLLPAVAWGRHRTPEVLALIGATAAVGVVLVVPGGGLGAAAPYLAVPVLLWAGSRFGVFGAAVTSGAVAMIIHVATATGHGAFVGTGDAELVVAQVYIGFFAVSGLAVGVLATDVEAHRRTEQDLLERTLHDPLTGLPNRAMVDLSLAQGGAGGVIMVDLDRFKPVNDAFGHHAGDVVLAEVADRLRAACRPSDLVARVGGDEFVVVLREILSEGELVETGRRIERVVAQPIAVDGAVVNIGASVGSVVVPPGAEPQELLREADRRMYAAKHARRRAGAPSAHQSPAKTLGASRTASPP